MSRILFIVAMIPSIAFAGVVEMSSVTASSTQKMEVSVNYEAENMTTPTGFTYWAEGDGSAGLGTRIDIKFPRSVELVGFALWNGSQSDAATWQNSNRVKTMEFEFKAGTFGDPVKEMLTVEDKIDRTVYKFAEVRTCDQLKIFLREVFTGDAYNETAISHITFLDNDAGEYAYATGATATSEADGFAARSAVDGLVDTPWCVAEGKGKGESLEIALPTGTKLKGLTGFFGINIDGEWEKNARPKAVKVQVGDKTFDWAIEDKQGSQDLDLGGIEASKIVINLSAVLKGRVYKDACVSEIQFRAAD